jgi:hypothetical protein
MPVNLPNPSAPAAAARPACNLSVGAARDALAEIRASRADLQALVAGAFDRLDSAIREQLGNMSPGAERETICGTVDQLAAVAAELTALVAEQQRLLAKQ